MSLCTEHLEDLGSRDSLLTAVLPNTECIIHEHRELGIPWGRNIPFLQRLNLKATAGKLMLSFCFIWDPDGARGGQETLEQMPFFLGGCYK